jgi:hypothetical protein
MTFQKFSSTHSPAVINKPNTGSNNILADWQRAINNDYVEIKINGKFLFEYSKKYNDFKEDGDLINFFNKVVLSPQLSEEKRQEVSGYLMKSFHQGGLMYPVSSAIRNCMREIDPLTREDCEYGALRDSTLKHQIAIVTTSSGFKVQEFCQAGEVLIYPGTSMSHLVSESDPILKPEENKGYIIKAQGIIDVDFSKNSNDPSIGVESNTIDFGHSALRAKVDSRSLTQIIIDFLKDIFGLNKVFDISPKPEPEPESEESSFRP